MEPPDEETPLRDFPWVVVRLRCPWCRRGGDFRLADVASKHGSRITIGSIVVAFMEGCEWRPWNPARKPQKYGMRCGGYCPDLRRPDPPDLPPSMVGLNLIEGGKDDQLPSSPDAPAKRKRRVGGGDF